jgi:hypothetical protein
MKSFCRCFTGPGEKKEAEKIRSLEVKKIEGFDTLFA